MTLASDVPLPSTSWYTPNRQVREQPALALVYLCRAYLSLAFLLSLVLSLRPPRFSWFLVAELCAKGA